MLIPTCYSTDLDDFKIANTPESPRTPLYIALIKNSNLHILQNLQPKSIHRGCIKAFSKVNTVEQWHQE
jgi:hypothetical protein